MNAQDTSVGAVLGSAVRALRTTSSYGRRN